MAYNQDYTAKLSFSIKGHIKVLLGQEKAKGAHHHQTSITRNVNGSYLRRRKAD